MVCRTKPNVRPSVDTKEDLSTLPGSSALFVVLLVSESAPMDSGRQPPSGPSVLNTVSARKFPRLIRSPNVQTDEGSRHESAWGEMEA